MLPSLCGADCSNCPFSTGCAGCQETDAHPFGQPCMVAGYCKQGADVFAAFRQKLIGAFNALPISGLPAVTELFALRGAFINMAFPLPGGETTKFWHDDRIYLGNQLPKPDTDRCYGLAGDDRYLMVCEYGENGSEPELLVFQRWQS